MLEVVLSDSVPTLPPGLGYGDAGWLRLKKENTFLLGTLERNKILIRNIKVLELYLWSML